MTRSETALLGAAKRFSNALDDAIYDKQYEARTPLLFLYDADLLVKAILGLTNTDPATTLPDVSKSPYIVRALFSVGFLPQAHFLRPHLVELERFIRQVSPPGGLEAGFRAQQFRLLAKQWELDRHDARVKEYAQDVAALQSVIRSEGFEIFVKLELCYGGLAYDRLLRILPRCAFQESALQRLPMRRNDAFAEEVAQFISRLMRRRPKGINNLVDGYALSELAQHVEAGRPVRFYTESESLVRFQHHRRLNDYEGRSVWRDAVYFIMRCSFPALSFDHLKAKPHENGSYEWKLEDLIELNQRLKTIFSDMDSGIDVAQIEIMIQAEKAGTNGGTLATLIDDFYALKFLSNVFLSRWEVPPAMADFVPFLAAFFQDSRRIADVRLALAKRLVATRKALRVEIGHLARWHADIAYFSNKIESRRRDFEGVVPDPWRDMGLGRWGLDVFLPNSVQRDLSSWLNELAGDADAVERLASDLALLVSPSRYRNWEDFALAQCELWCLKLYDRIVTEWEENAENIDAPEKEVLRILFLVAQVKTFKAGLGETSKAQVARIRTFVDQAQGNLEFIRSNLKEIQTRDDRQVEGVAYMGIAHVAYWAWQRLRELNETSIARDMAELSFDAAQHALALFPVRSLAWAFAVNHCLYVGTTSRVRKAEAESMWPELFHANAAYQHYRFADTRVRQATEELRERISHYGASNLASNPELGSVRNQLCEDIRKAERTLLGAGSYFGDEEILEHRMLLESWQISLRCRDSSIGVKKRRLPPHA
jgi:hypothetical protein